MLQLRGKSLVAIGRTDIALAALERVLNMARRAGYHPQRVEQLAAYRSRIDAAVAD